MTVRLDTGLTTHYINMNSRPMGRVVLEIPLSDASCSCQILVKSFYSSA